MTAAFAVSAALNADPRGTYLDVAMSEAVISTMGWVVSNYLVGGVTPEAHGNENTTSAPSGTFETSDGLINIAANRDEQWQALARNLDRKDLLDHPDYETREDRKRNRHALREALEETLRTRAASDWVRELNAIGVPAGQVLTVPEALDDEQLAGRGLIGSLQVQGEDMKLAGSPVVLNGLRQMPRTAPPQLGADNSAIWSEIGLSCAEIDALSKEGII